MANYQFLNDVSAVCNMEGPITKGPLPRYERKKLQTQKTTNLSSLSTSASASSTSLSLARSFSCMNLTKTPTSITKRKKPISKTPQGNNKLSTLGASSIRTPTVDRFIPSRVASNLDLAHFKLKNVTAPVNNKINSDPTVVEGSGGAAVANNANTQKFLESKIFTYSTKAPSAPSSFQNPLRVLYCQTPLAASTVKNGKTSSSYRHFPKVPDRILDAPDIIDDFYLNLLDWGANNTLAAALGNQVYLWNAGTGNIEILLTLDNPADYVCSLAWIQEGDTLAVGTTDGAVQLWDCAVTKRLRTMTAHSARVGALAWNQYVLTSGARSGQLINHDVRQREHVLNTINAHAQEICGIKWSPNGRYLASGGNDNTVHIWQQQQGELHSTDSALYTFTQHQAAVKALAWCPWQPHILATGGGTADRHIRTWNCNIGSCVNQVDTRSQVCALLWSDHYKELVSGHGFAQNEVIIWKYPSMSRVAELKGHTARVLHLALSPDGSTILSAGADETLRLWKCFEKKKDDAKKTATSMMKDKKSRTGIHQTIR